MGEGGVFKVTAFLTTAMPSQAETGDSIFRKKKITVYDLL